MTQNNKLNESQSTLSASQMLAQYLIGDCTIPRSRFPKVEWLRVDGNIFSLIPTASRAWRKVDTGVYQRIGTLCSLAMTGVLEGQPAISAKMEEEVSKGVDGYYLLLGVLTDVCPDCSEEDEDDC